MGSQYSGEYIRAMDEAEDRIRELLANPDKAWFKAADPEVAIDYLWATLRGETPHNIDLIGNYLVLWAVCVPWWSDQKLLQESMVLRVGPPEADGMDRVIQFLEAKAQELCCAGLGTGTALSLNDRALTRLYERHGFVVESTNLYKET